MTISSLVLFNFLMSILVTVVSAKIILKRDWTEVFYFGLSVYGINFLLITILKILGLFLFFLEGVNTLIATIAGNLPDILKSFLVLALIHIPFFLGMYLSLKYINRFKHNEPFKKTLWIYLLTIVISFILSFIIFQPILKGIIPTSPALIQQSVFLGGGI